MSELVQKLSQGEHPVEVSLRPKKTIEGLKECIERGYLHVKFTATKGGTELGVRLNNDLTNLSEAGFDNQTGSAQFVGGLTLDYVKGHCIRKIDLSTLTGSGHLERLEG